MTLTDTDHCDTWQWITAITVVLYLYAGHQSWRLVNIVGATEDALQAEFRAGRTPWGLYVTFVALWPILMGGATVFNLITKLTNPKR
jgi:hypothetical protein